jgi:hypothetical protein
MEGKGEPAMVSVFEGPAPFAQMVRDELVNRGVRADLQTLDPTGLLSWGSVATPPRFQAVVVHEDEANSRRAVIDEVLALVSHADEEGRTKGEG